MADEERNENEGTTVDTNVAGEPAQTGDAGAAAPRRRKARIHPGAGDD